MPQPNLDRDRLVLGLVPALTVEETFQFGPLTISPVSDASDPAFSEVAARYADERGASREHQAFVTCPDSLRPLILTVWPLFVFACVSYSRRQRHPSGGVTFPENLHLPAITSSGDGLIYSSGHSMGVGEAKHLPLPWPVDWATTLQPGWWDRRIELACTRLARNPEKYASNQTAVAAAMAADLACAALERRSQKVQNVATSARTFVLLGSAFEALHAKGRGASHEFDTIIEGVRRLDAGPTSLGDRVFSVEGMDRPPKPTPGKAVTRPMFVTAQLLHIRNAYAHGRSPSSADFVLPEELNRAHPMQAATLVLAALIGDDLSQELNCVVPEETGDMIAVQHRLGLPVDQAYRTVLDGRALLDALAEMIVPEQE